MKTRFFRFLMSLFMYSHGITKRWTDETLYNRYGLSQQEIAFIESGIRPMEASDE